MAKLGSEKNPVVLRVQTEERMKQMARICHAHGWKFIIGIEPDKPENISDVERLLNPSSCLTQKMQLVFQKGA